MADTRLRIEGLKIECSREAIVGYTRGHNPSWAHECLCGVTHCHEDDGSIRHATEVFIETYAYEDGETSDIYELRCESCGAKIEWPNPTLKPFSIPGLVDVRFSGVLPAGHRPCGIAFDRDILFEDETGMPRFSGYITGVDTSGNAIIVRGIATKVFACDDAG